MKLPRLVRQIGKRVVSATPILRRHMLSMARGQGQGYIGQGLGIADVLAALYFHRDALLHTQSSSLRQFGGNVCPRGIVGAVAGVSAIVCAVGCK